MYTKADYIGEIFDDLTDEENKEQCADFFDLLRWNYDKSDKEIPEEIKDVLYTATSLESERAFVHRMFEYYRMKITDDL